MPQLTVLSLNVGRFLQERTRAYLQSLGTAEPLPDVLCLQDIPFRDLPLLERWPHIAFAPMTNHLINGVRAVVGIAIVSRYFMSDIVHRTTWGDGKLKDLQGINDHNQRHLGAESDVLVEATEDRVVVCATIVVENNELTRGKFNIATTHGMWMRDGVTNDVQRESTRNLLAFLRKEWERRDGLLLVGDMNFGRDSEMSREFRKQGLRNCMPLEIENTLDPGHPFSKRGGKVVTDWIFDYGRHDRMHMVENVRLHTGVSDHCALSATVWKEYGL